MKRFIKKILSHEIKILIQDIITHYRKLRILYLKGSKFGFNDLDNKLSKYLNFQNGFYIELGANDGVLASNTYYLQKKLNWNGILIEPSPNLYTRCKKNRGNKNKVLCYACVSKDYKKKFVEMIYSDSMTVANDLESDIKNPEEHAQKGKDFLSEHEDIFKFKAQAETLTNIINDNSDVAIIDFISLDVEGAEIEVLKGLDFKEITIKYLLIESRDLKKLEPFLVNFGFILIDKLSVHDYLFVNKQFDC